MKERSAGWLDRSQRALESARRELAAGALGFAADRAYYAMFYVVKALLTERGLEHSSHGAVHAAYGQEFAKGGNSIRNSTAGCSTPSTRGRKQSTAWI